MFLLSGSRSNMRISNSIVVVAAVLATVRPSTPLSCHPPPQSFLHSMLQMSRWRKGVRSPLLWPMVMRAWLLNGSTCVVGGETLAYRRCSLALFGSLSKDLPPFVALILTEFPQQSELGFSFRSAGPNKKPEISGNIENWPMRCDAQAKTQNLISLQQANILRLLRLLLVVLLRQLSLNSHPQRR